MSNALAQLVQQIARGDETPWVPRAQQPTVHLGALSGVDLGRNTVSLVTNVPAMTELPTVPFLQSYSAAMMPNAGDLVRFLHFGTTVLVLGRQVVPDSAILLGWSDLRMTTYAATAAFSFSTANVTQWIGVRAGSYELKIPQIDYSSQYQYMYFIAFQVYRYSTSTMSGGTAITPFPLRQGSAAASATAASGALTFSGTQNRLNATYVGGGTNIVQNNVVNTLSGSISVPFDLTVAPGSAIAISISNSISSSTIAQAGVFVSVPFEELRLAWHY